MLHSFPSISSLPPANYLTIQLINQSTVFRKRDGDGATRTAIVGRRHRPPHELNEFFHQGQADAGSAGGAGEGVFHAVKIIKNFFQSMAGDSGPGISYHYLHLAVFLANSNPYRPFGGALTEFHAVFDQIDQYLYHYLVVIFKRSNRTGRHI